MDGDERWAPGAGWCTGPPGDRRRYRVATPEPLPGGQGYVFEAEGPDGGPVALKLVGEVDDDTEVRLGRRWATIIASPHARLARPIDLFRGPGLFPAAADVAPADDESDLLYLASGWVSGRTLRVAAPLDRDGVGRLAVDLADALTHLHDECGLVHRDVHPGNVIVGDDGHASLIDLGAVRPDDGTATTTVSGVLGFIAPELTHGPGDRRSDGWGLGMVVVFALVGRPRGSQSETELRRQLLAALHRTPAPDRAVRLLEQAVATDPATRPTDLRRWAADLATALGASGRPRPAEGRRVTSRIRLVGAAIAAAAVLIAGVVAATLDGDDGDDGGDPTAAVLSTGSTGPIEPEAVCTADFATPAMAAAAGGACASGSPTAFGDAVVQAVHGAGPSGVVLESPAGAVRLTDAQHVSYREIAGRERPENAITFGGYPTGVGFADGLHTVELSMGGVIVGPRDDTQSFWLPPTVHDLWRARGGVGSDLGLPMTNPRITDDGVQQDFAGGHLLLPAGVLPFPMVDADLIEVHLEPDPAAPLDGLAIEGRIVRQPSGTSWWVDEERRRRWIPDGDTYVCLGGDPVLVANDVPGSAIATLALGPPATCGD